MARRCPAPTATISRARSPTAVWPKSFSHPARGRRFRTTGRAQAHPGVAAGRPAVRNQMIDEAHVAMSLNHSNIVQVLDLGHARGRYFLVLELVEGWDLNQNPESGPRAASFPLLPELALYGRRRGLPGAGLRPRQDTRRATRGIVHREREPAQRAGQRAGRGQADGLRHRQGHGPARAHGHGVIKGKLAFMSPEQASGTAVDGRSDLFSLGTVLYLLARDVAPSTPPNRSRGPSARAAVPVRPARPKSRPTSRPSLPASPCAPCRPPGEPLPKAQEEMLVRHRDRAAFCLQARGPDRAQALAGGSAAARWRATISKAASQTPALDDSQALAARRQ